MAFAGEVSAGPLRAAGQSMQLPTCRQLVSKGGGLLRRAAPKQLELSAVGPAGVAAVLPRFLAAQADA